MMRTTLATATTALPTRGRFTTSVTEASDDGNPHGKAHEGDAVVLGPVHEVAVGNGKARVHEHDLGECPHAQGGHNGNDHVERAAAEHGERKPAGKCDEETGNNHQLPDLPYAKEQAARAACHKLERGYHKHGKGEKRAGKKREREAAAPGDARRAARGGPARVAARGCKRLSRRRVGRGLAGGVDAGDRGLGHAPRPLVYVQDRS